MQLSLRFGLSCSLGSLLCACGSASAPKPVMAPTNQAPAALQQLPPAPDLSPVLAPKGLVGVGRLARPGELTKTFAGWVSLPFEPGMVDAVQPGLSQALAFDAPVEFALVLPEGEVSARIKPEFVVSVGLSSVEKARTLLEEYLGQKLVERGPSVYVTPDGGKYHCAIAAALGKAANRFVCADKPASLEHLLPYATRGLPLENLGVSDLHAELRFEPMRQQFGAALRMGRTVAVPALLKEISLSDARFDRALADVAHAVGDELLDLFEDADKLVMDASVTEKPERIDAKLTIAYRGTASFVSQATVDARKRMQPPNAQFFDLPADAEGAGYIVSADPKRLDKQRSLVESLAEGLLAHFEVGAPLRREVRAALDTVFNSSSVVVFADGPIAVKGDRAMLSDADRTAMALGWRIYGVEGAAASYKDAVKTLIRLTSDKAFQKGIDGLLDRTGSADANQGKPKGKTWNRTPDWLKFKSKTIAGMPAGSEVMLVELNRESTKELLAQADRKVRRGKKFAPLDVSALRALFAVVPDGGRTWFVFAMDEKTLLDRSKVVLGSSKSPRLSTRSDLQTMRGLSANQAGFSTLELVKGWLQAAMVEQKKPIKEADTLYSTLPHHGSTPMFYRTIIGGSDKQPTVEVSTSLPRAVFEDVAAAVPTLMMLHTD
jgi:hypothetical protein